MQYQVNNFESEKLEVSLKRDQNLDSVHGIAPFRSQQQQGTGAAAVQRKIL